MKDFEILETHRTFFRLLNNTTSFFLTADVALVGFGANNKSVLLILLGGIFPILIMISYYLYSRIYCAIFFSAMQSSELGDDGKLFLSTNLAMTHPTLLSELESIVELENRERQLDRLQHIKNKFIPPYSRIILATAVGLHILASIAVWYFGGWSFA